MNSVAQVFVFCDNKVIIRALLHNMLELTIKCIDQYFILHTFLPLSLRHIEASTAAKSRSFHIFQDSMSSE